MLRIAASLAGFMLVTALAGCAGGGSGADGGIPCESDPDCLDAHECTRDRCGVDGFCVYTPINELCPDGQVCEEGRGCVSSASCRTDDDCVDAHECTIDGCGVGGICNHDPVDAICADGEVCDPMTGCGPPPGCGSSADCDDDVTCTRDSCGVDRTCNNVPVDEMCNMAMGERCSPISGCYVPMPCTTAADCDDHQLCNGMEICMPEFGCAPAETPFMCNDSEDCTIDSCDSSMPGENPGDMGRCIFACDPSRGPACLEMCPPPALGCNGRFRVTAATTMFQCIYFGVITASSADFSEVTLELADGVLSVRPRSYMTMPMPPGGLVLSDTTDPVCPSFDASVTVDGMCAEHYRLTGMFTDDNNFTGTLEVSFTGDCADYECTAGTFPATGTRI